MWLQSDVRFEPNNGHKLTSDYSQLKICFIILTFYEQLQLCFNNAFPKYGYKLNSDYHNVVKS